MNCSAPGAQARAWVLNWQRKLHRWSAEDQNKTFGNVYNFVCDPKTLRIAWEHLKANRGSKTAGVDGITRYRVEKEIGLEKFLNKIHVDLRRGTYRPLPVREKGIPKKSGKVRYLGIPAMCDRVVQQALRMVLEPIFEAGFYSASYGYRPGRRTQDAIAEIYHFTHPHSGYEWIVEGDIQGCFDNIEHVVLLREIRKRVTDKKILRLVTLFLRAGVMTEMGTYRGSITGTPQGGIISPLLANIYLTILDRHFQKRWEEMNRYPNYRQHLRRKGLPTYRMVRFADDFVILVKGTKEQAEALKTETAQLLRDQLHMELSAEKTRITHIQQGFDFLGHHIRLFQKKETAKMVLYTLPSKKSLESAKKRVKAITSRETTRLSLGAILGKLNPLLRGWSYYFRFDAAKRTLSYLGHYAWERVFRWMRNKHSRIGVRALRRRHFPGWQFREGERVLFRPSTVTVERYRFRGAQIANPWQDKRPISYQMELGEAHRLEILEQCCHREF